MKERFETYEKVNGRFIFMGWYPMTHEEFCIKTKLRTYNDENTYVYKTYKWRNGEISETKYIVPNKNLQNKYRYR